MKTDLVVDRLNFLDCKTVVISLEVYGESELARFEVPKTWVLARDARSVVGLRRLSTISRPFVQ